MANHIVLPARCLNMTKSVVISVSRRPCNRRVNLYFRVRFCLRFVALAIGIWGRHKVLVRYTSAFSSPSIHLRSRINFERNLVGVRCDAVRVATVIHSRKITRRGRRRRRTKVTPTAKKINATKIEHDETLLLIKNITKSKPDYRRIPPISDTTPCELIEDEEFYFPSPEEWSLQFPKGDQGGYHIVREYTIGCDAVENGTNTVILMANGTSNGTTLQHALAILDPENYPTLTRARKACRKGMILVRRNHLTNNNTSGSEATFARGKVGDILRVGDVIGCQMFLGTFRKKTCYPNIEYPRPQFELPVLYEDDHLAVVNKPAGIAVYSETRMDGSGASVGNRRTVHFVLPFVLSPPSPRTNGVLRRPGIVHRLDKATSGLLVVAKTKIAMESLKDQFENRKIQKRYTAIINGDLLPEHLLQRGDDLVDGQNCTSDESYWNVIDYPLGGKVAITAWQISRRSLSLNAKDGILTMINVRLHTGRYHQIRRHFAWWCRRPLVGDPLYAGLLQAHHFRKKGLFLCSSGIAFEHPLKEDKDVNETGKLVEIKLNIPKRFDKLMNAEEAWARSKTEVADP